MALSHSQRKIVRKSLKTAKRLHASPRQKKSLIEAELVESGISNPKGGDRDSEGVLQQRPSQGWGSPAQVTNVPHAVTSFIAAAKKADHGQPAGQLAQAVQRSAYPDRYGQVASEAHNIIKQFSKPGALRGSGSGGSRTRTKTTRGVDNSAARRRLVVKFAQNLGHHRPDALLNLGLKLAAVQDTPSRKVRVRAPGKRRSTKASHAQKPARTPRLATFDGKTVAGWIAPYLEYARQHGWKGTVNSGYRSYAEQKKIYDSGVRPAAKPGTSNHEGARFPRGAVDVSDAPQLSAILKGYPGGSKLQWAGSKDPVHFSHPHNGGY